MPRVGCNVLSNVGQITDKRKRETSHFRPNRFDLTFPVPSPIVHESSKPRRIFRITARMRMETRQSISVAAVIKLGERITFSDTLPNAPSQKDRPTLTDFVAIWHLINKTCICTWLDAACGAVAGLLRDRGRYSRAPERGIETRLESVSVVGSSCHISQGQVEFNCWGKVGSNN